MRIRRLARNAAFIAVAATVMGGFATGIAQATSVVPTSTVSASSVTSGGTAPRVNIPNMPASCGVHFCTLGLAGGPHPFEYIIQEFACVLGGHSNITNPIYGMQNNCGRRVYWYNPSSHCIEPNSSLAGVGRFGHVYSISVGAPVRC
jgi:hypothetical protein